MYFLASYESLTQIFLGTPLIPDRSWRPWAGCVRELGPPYSSASGDERCRSVSIHSSPTATPQDHSGESRNPLSFHRLLVVLAPLRYRTYDSSLANQGGSVPWLGTRYDSIKVNKMKSYWAECLEDIQSRSSVDIV